MLRAASVIRSGEFDEGRVIDRVALDADDRNRRRVVLTGEGGTTFLLDLPQAAALRHGDGLVLDDAGIVRVIGVAEPLAEMRTKTPLDFVRLAWHLGNRHADVAFAPGALRVRRDHVLEAMAEGLGANVKPVEAAFDPEPSTPHHPDHGHDHDHDHDHHVTAVERSPVATHQSDREPHFPAAALYRLQAWLSPAYPVGAFSFSSGLEWAIEAGDIVDAPTLQSWLSVILADGGGFCDAVFFVHAHRAIEQRDDNALAAVAELALAFAPSKERHLETTAQGSAFLAATRAAWPCAALDRLGIGPCAYPVAVAAAAAGHGISLAPALAAYLHALAANLISAGVRLIPLGQTDGQRVLAALEPIIAATAERALATPLDEVGGAAFRADLASLRHETKYTRLFRS